jgi:hypothetical protein
MMFHQGFGNGSREYHLTHVLEQLVGGMSVDQ